MAVTPQHKAYMRARRDAAKEWVRVYKSLSPCVDCGEDDPIVLDFDHREPHKKSFNISAAICRGSGISLEKLEFEVEKCDVRCANCHRRRTHHQRTQHRALIDNF